VLSVAGASEQGFYNSNLLLVETERAMMHAADEVIVVADSTKFGRTSLAHLGDLGSIDTLVTDHEIASEWRTRLEAAEVKVMVADTVPNAASGPASDRIAVKAAND
jgi:DeoR family fructose operon transcriptional repressor